MDAQFQQFKHDPKMAAMQERVRRLRERYNVKAEINAGALEKLDEETRTMRHHTSY